MGGREVGREEGGPMRGLGTNHVMLGPIRGLEKNAYYGATDVISGKIIAKFSAVLSRKLVMLLLCVFGWYFFGVFWNCMFFLGIFLH